MNVTWKIRLAQTAEDDFRQITRWTTANFGRRQARTYAITLTNAIHVLANGPNVPGARSREEIGPGIHTLHVARQGRRGRHFVVFRTSSDEQCIEVLRVFHDAKDLRRHFG